MRGRGPWEVKTGWRGCREVLGSDQTGDSLGNHGVELSDTQPRQPALRRPSMPRAGCRPPTDQAESQFRPWWHPIKAATDLAGVPPTFRKRAGIGCAILHRAASRSEAVSVRPTARAGPCSPASESTT